MNMHAMTVAFRRATRAAFVLFSIALSTLALAGSTQFYAWNTSGNYIFQTDNPWFQADITYGASNTWIVDKAGNCLYDNSGTCRSLPTSAFNVGDILDITYTGGTNHDVVMLAVGTQETIPEPMTISLIGISIGAMLFTRRRTSSGEKFRNRRQLT